MNNRQKLGYMVLGAVVLAVGIAIGQFMTPNIEAQNNGVFDTITCRKIEVVDEIGDPRILLAENKDGSLFTIFDELAEPRIQLGAGEGPQGAVFYGKAGHEKIIFGSSEEYPNSIIILDRAGNVIWRVPE